MNDLKMDIHLYPILVEYRVQITSAGEGAPLRVISAVETLIH